MKRPLPPPEEQLHVMIDVEALARVPGAAQDVILRTMKTLAKDPHGFFERHPGIPPDVKQKRFAVRLSSLNTPVLATPIPKIPTK